MGRGAAILQGQCDPRPLAEPHPRHAEANKTPPKWRCSAAQRRHLVAFELQLAQDKLGATPVEEAAKTAMWHLHQCYRCLKERSVKFALQCVALEQTFLENQAQTPPLSGVVFRRKQAGDFLGVPG